MTAEPPETPFDPNDFVDPTQGRHQPRALRFRMGGTEFIKTGLSIFDPHDPYYFAVSLSWSRFFLLFVAAEIVINTAFALLYMAQPGSIGNQQTPGFPSAFFFSLETLATVGYGEMYPGTLYGHIVSAFEILTGVIFMAIMTGLLFVRFSKPKAKFVYAENPVLTMHNGKPTLMLRVGNARVSPLHDARAYFYTMVRAASDEGQMHANVVSLELTRNRYPIFAILWTVMHIVDANSPLYPLLADPNALKGMRLFFTLTARDPQIGQEVTDLHTFFADDIRVGMRYVDAIRTDEKGRVIADYRRISAIEADMMSVVTDRNRLAATN